VNEWLVAAIATLLSWLVVARTTWALTRPERTRPDPGKPGGELQRPEDESTLAVLHAVTRSRKDAALSVEVVRGALNSLHRREMLAVEDRGAQGVWLRPITTAAPADLPVHERMLFDRVTACAARARGPIPLGALTPSWGAPSWPEEVTTLACDDARERGLVRKRLPAALVGILTVWGLAPVLLLLVAASKAFMVTGDNAFAGIIGAIGTFALIGKCLNWTGGTVLSSAGQAAVLRAATEPSAPALQQATMPVAADETQLWSTATGSWRCLPVRADHPRSVPRAPLRVVGRVVQRKPKDESSPFRLIVDDAVSDALYTYRVTSEHFKRAPIGSWVVLHVPAGRRGITQVTRLVTGSDAHAPRLQH
jgi:hypothetical protein